jgi:hypothetical protein
MGERSIAWTMTAVSMTPTEMYAKKFQGCAIFAVVE